MKEEEICSPTTQGPRNITIGTYLYDETNRMVQGANKTGEASLYTFNGLGVRVGSELILKDNTHGYTDFHCQTPSIETTVGGPQGPEVVKADYVIDYTRLNIDQRVLMKLEEGGYDFRYVYGLDKIQVTVNSEGSNWWGQNIKPCVMMNYVHTDRLGSVVNLSDQYGRVTARVDYDDWGKVTAYTDITVDGGFRRLLPEITYATHEYDDVLDMFYAKARMYDADNRRFTAVDSILEPSQFNLREYVGNPVQMVQYAYVFNSPLNSIDCLGTNVCGVFGYNASVSAGWATGGEEMVIWDDKGNMVSMYAVSGCASTGLSLNVGVTVEMTSTASDVFEFVYGYSMNVGGSVSLSVVSVGEDIIIGGETTGKSFLGQATKVTAGVGTPIAELHTSLPIEAHISNVLKYKGDWVPDGVTIDYFNDLSCPIKEKCGYPFSSAGQKSQRPRLGAPGERGRRNGG